jgi:hypothetical protein
MICFKKHDVICNTYIYSDRLDKAIEARDAAEKSVREKAEQVCSEIHASGGGQAY